MDNKTKNIILIGLGLVSSIGIVYYLYKKYKKVSSNDQTDSQNNNNNVQNSNIDVIDDNLDINVTNTKAYSYIQRQLKDVQDLLSNYEKTDTTLLDIQLNQRISTRAEETLYIMITKNWITIKNGILNDTSLNAEQRKVLLKMYQDYFNVVLPRYFDKDKYNINEQWYQDKVSQMSIINLYE